MGHPIPHPMGQRPMSTRVVDVSVRNFKHSSFPLTAHLGALRAAQLLIHVSLIKCHDSLKQPVSHTTPHKCHDNLGMWLPYRHAGGATGASPLFREQLAALRHSATAMKGKARGYTRAQRPKSARPALGGPNRSWRFRTAHGLSC